MPRVLALPLLLLLLLLLLLGLPARAVLPNGYFNNPIADPTNNSEINTNGYPLQTNFGMFNVPQARAWCQANNNCSSSPSPTSASSSGGGTSDNCYTPFYFDTQPPFNYSHCSIRGTVNGSGDADFNQYNISYTARLYLMDLDANGFANITQLNDAAASCAPLFTDLCYVVMWVQNMRAGWGCPQAAAPTFKGQPFLPPCQSWCHNLMTSSCNTFQGAILAGAYSINQMCELLPNSVHAVWACALSSNPLSLQNCLSHAPGLPVPSALLVVVVVALVVALLFSL